jgi:hypothetical protein
MYPLYLLAGNKDGSVEQPVICNLKSFKIYTSEGLVRDFVPVVKKNTKEAGLYDRVTQEFYGNAGTGEFTAPEPKEETIILPAGYTALESISSNEKQYINTGVVPTVDTGFEITYNVHDEFVNNDTRAGALFGARTAWWNNAFNLTTYSDGSYRQGHLLYGGMASSGSNVETIRHNAGMSKDIKETLSFSHGVLTKPDLTTAAFDPGTGINTPYPIYIFGINQAGSFIEPSTMDLYRFKLFDGDELIRDFIPALRKEDGKVGLYCQVTDTFYTNSGTGEFTYTELPTRLPANYTQLDYLQSTGTQYINTGVAPNSIDFKIEIKYQYLEERNTGSDAVAGARLGGERTRFYICRNLNTTTSDRLVLGNTTKT